jgi:diadenylate cyclase
MTLNTVFSIIKKVVDICFVWIILYYILRSIRKNVKLSMLIKGIVIVVLVKLISDYFGLVTVGLLFEYVITWAPLAIIIIFQPEIRTTLESLGKANLLGRHKTLTVNEREKLVSELGIALDY